MNNLFLFGVTGLLIWGAYSIYNKQKFVIDYLQSVNKNDSKELLQAKWRGMTPSEQATTYKIIVEISEGRPPAFGSQLYLKAIEISQKFGIAF